MSAIKRINKGISMSPVLYARVEKYMEETGVGFSAFMQSIISNYFDQREALDAMSNLTPLLQKIEELQKLEEQKK